MNDLDTVVIPQDMDDTARLILMDVARMTAGELRLALRANGVHATITQAVALVGKYLGQGFEFATHDVVTGERYTWGN